jgi:hypothetical protein
MKKKACEELIEQTKIELLAPEKEMREPKNIRSFEIVKSLKNQLFLSIVIHSNYLFNV